jgi:sec-independent protein translocase protein TatA
MGGASIWHWIVLGAVVLVLFGRGKISEMMGDVAKGIKAFKKGMNEDEATAANASTTAAPAEPGKIIDQQPVKPAEAKPVDQRTV